MPLIINDLSYSHPDREPLFSGIGMSLRDGEKAALTGNNGTGKSTLLKIIAGVLKPTSGNISHHGSLYFVPQHFGQYDTMDIAHALGIADKTAALHAILGGDLSAENYTTLDDDWTIEERARAALSAWGLEHISPDTSMSKLSGGEKTKVFLAGILVHSPSLILLDEPSNHLDTAAREQLYTTITGGSASVLVVSHDRTLLNLIDTIYELSPKGIEKYGGNYDFYEQAKNERLDALLRNIDEKEKVMKAALKTAREAMERKQRLDSRADKKGLKEGIPHIMINTLRDKADASSRKLADTHSAKIEGIAKELSSARSELPQRAEMRVKFGDPSVHKGKTLVTAKGINFAYNGKPLWSSPLDLRITSGQRTAIIGGNGSGKTTLLKLILGELAPTSGSIERASFSHIYLDQEYSFIDSSLTVIEQAERFNTRNLPEHMLKTELHRFLFPVSAWDKKCSSLSGGEKIRLLFCSLLISDSMPDMFILDEPTNNLDIESLGIVASSLKDYDGTILAVSHDRRFLADIMVDGETTLPSRG